MTEFGIVSATGMKEITPDQAVQWAFGNFFAPFGISKIIVVNADGLFSGIYRNIFQHPSTCICKGKRQDN